MTTDAPDTGTDPTATDQPTQDQPDTGADLTAELEKWKAQARKHEDRAKANAAAAKELEQLKQQSMTDQEKAVEAAKAAARAEVLAEVGASRVDDAVRVALAGRPVDVDALLEGLDRSRFLDDTGTPDRDAIGAWVDRIAPLPEQPETQQAQVFDLGQGARSSSLGQPLDSDPLLRDLKSKLGIA